MRGKVQPGAAIRNKELLAHERKLANQWCAQHAIEISEIDKRLPFKVDLKDPETEFPVIFRDAFERVKTCPVKLGGAGNLILIYSLACALEPRRIIESGVAYGWSSLAFLLAINHLDEARLFSVDMPYLVLQNDEWVGIAVPPDLHPKWKLYRLPDRKGLPIALRTAGSINLAHYDSDKSASGRAFGYQEIWRALCPGGVLISDDVSDNLAFRDFTNAVERTPIVIAQDTKYQGVLVK